MNKDLIETPRFIRSLGDEVLLKGRLVAFDIDENNRVENVVRLEYGQTINVPNYSIYTKNNIIYEPEKVKVQQFVADWIKYFKKCSGTLYGSTVPYSYYGRAITDGFEGDVTETLRWICNNSETYARAWLDGYEVEKEKRYRVKVKGICGNHETLNREKHSNKWLFSDREENSLYGTHHTRKELEDAGFSEVFNSPLFEVEEVE